MGEVVLVAGVGVIPFRKPGNGPSYVEMGAGAVRNALKDAGLAFESLQQAYAGYVYGDSTSGQRALYEVGMTGIPIFNVNNNCSTGSTALYLARQAVASGAADCVLAFGFEQMQPGALSEKWADRPSTFARFNEVCNEVSDGQDLPFALRYFGAAGQEHMQKYGTRIETFAKIRAKASQHAEKNPIAVFRNALTVEEVLASPTLWPGVLTRLMVCPPTCGAAAAILVSESFARRHGIESTVKIAGQSMVTDYPTTFDSRSMIELVGFGLSVESARQAYEEAGIGPQDVDVCELHDCFAQNELLTYEALGFCRLGDAEAFVWDEANTYGGKIVTNPSGGLLSKGHPLGATGLAQCYELVRQLRGTAGTTQVERARIGLQHNLGLGSAAVVTIYAQA